MKKIICLLVMLSTIGYGQMFDEQSSQQNNQQSQFFQEHQPMAPDPDQGLDAEPPPDDDDVPIDDWLFLLPLAGVLVGVYYLQRKQKLV